MHAADDASVSVDRSLGLFAALKAAGVPAEMHLFSAGGHGFGIQLAAGKPVEAWPDLLVRWGRYHQFFLAAARKRRRRRWGASRRPEGWTPPVGPAPFGVGAGSAPLGRALRGVRQFVRLPRVRAGTILAAMHRLAVVALPRVVPFDLSAPCEIFGRARLPDGSPAYDVVVCGPERQVSSGPFDLRLRHGLSALARADTIVLPGLDDLRIAAPAPLVRALWRAAARGARIASVCSGAFLLASTGLLDGRRATTHWVIAPELSRLYPRVSVDPAVLYVDEGQLLSSAGAAAAFDLCLHMVRRDHGASVAATAARLSVMPLERDGGQSQFIERPPPEPQQGSLCQVLDWLQHNLACELTTAQIARRAGMSVRNFNRRFREQTGTTPKRWLVRARLRHAQTLLETSAHGVERIGAAAGFRSPVAFREQFRRALGLSPLAYRRAFRARC